MKGILIVNKPKGYTSQDVVSKVKKILDIKKAGHTGTLDPLATGILPVMLGEYTKLSKYLIEHDKTYIAKIRLGEKSSTGDLEGEIIENKSINSKLLDKENVSNVLSSFKGKQLQTPPIYSSIKINGKKLYEYAREGKKVEIPKREIKIYDIKLLNIVNNEIEFEVSCSKGTYIRTLCEDIAEKLETVGLMSSLIRTKVDNFTIDDSIELDKLDKSNIKLITMKEIFKEYKNIVIDEKKLVHFLNGVCLSYNIDDGIYNIYDNANNYIGLGIVKNKLLKRDVIDV